MSTRNRALWEADLAKELAGLDLWAQRKRLAQRIARADAWLARHPDADEVAIERLEFLAEAHAAIEEKIAHLRQTPEAEICLLLPADFGGAVSGEWHRDEQERIVAWFTRDEFAEALLINGALADLALEQLAIAA